MKRLRSVRYMFWRFVIVASLAGCGGPQPSIGAPGAAAAEVFARQAAAGTHNLLYVSSPISGMVYVYTYPDLKSYGTTGVLNAESRGECTDSSGDVFVTTTNASETNGTIYEFSHGGTMPIAALSDPGVPSSCAIDPATENLAVSNLNDDNNPYNEYAGDIALYDGAQGSPTMYYSSKIGFVVYCGFDNRSDLYAAGVDIDTGAKVLFALAQGSSSLTEISLNKIPVSSFGGVQWDGHHVALTVYRNQTPAYIYRLRFNGEMATSVGKTGLESGQEKFAGQSLIVNNRIMAITDPGRKANSNVDIFAYPRGGGVKRKLQVGPLLQGLAISH